MEMFKIYIQLSANYISVIIRFHNLEAICNIKWAVTTKKSMKAICLTNLRIKMKKSLLPDATISTASVAKQSSRSGR